MSHLHKLLSSHQQLTMPSPTAPLSLSLPLSLFLLLTNHATPAPMPNTTSASSCPSYRCGNVVDVRYPFWVAGATSYCGYPSLQLQCRRGTPVLALPSGDYAVTRIDYAGNTVSLVDLGIFSASNACPLVGRNLSLPAGSPLSLTPRDSNLTFFLHCSFMDTPTHLVACLEGDGAHHSYVFCDGDDMPLGYAASLCAEVVGKPVLRRALGGGGGLLDAVGPALNRGFELSWAAADAGECGGCEKAGGRCGQRRREGRGEWAFACFQAEPAATVAPKAG